LFDRYQMEQRVERRSEIHNLRVNSMRRLLSSMMVMGMVVSLAWAADESAAKAPEAKGSFEALKAEFEAATQKWMDGAKKEFEAAKKAGTEKNFKPSQENPVPSYSPRFLAIAEKDPKGPSAFDALRMTLNTSGGPKGPTGTWSKAVKILSEYYATKPGLERVITLMARQNHPESDQFVRDVIAKNPDRTVQAKAYKAMLNARESAAQTADQLNANEKLRQMVENRQGKAAVDQVIKQGEAAKKEIDELRKTYGEKYRDLVEALSIGNTMPALTSEGLDGKTVSLADYKGKVVVLDIWATWCGPCKAMIPHEREMVEKFKDKPFALVSISFDAEKKTLTDFLATEKMPWNHWWNGAEGKLIDTLEIEVFPTIFVLDGSGKIRYKAIRGEELEKAVNGLLKDMEPKKTASAN
jgi:thiol-disulfide isomerase/thioredoxin